MPKRRTKAEWKISKPKQIFIQVSGKSLPFFKALNKCTKKSDFQRITKAEAAFKQIKKLIAELPTLTAPMEKEELIIYLAAAREAISTVLMTKREAKQIPVYFVSRTLQGPKVNYTPLEKMLLALVHASKRLKRYFQAHTIIVITDQPIKQVLSKPEITGRLQKWSIKLGNYDIQYMPRTLVKGQILADFIVKHPEDDSLVTTTKPKEELPDPCTLFTDESSCIDGFGASLILTNSEGTEFTYALRFRFDATNNEAEYKALIASLRIAEQIELNEKSKNKAEVLAVVEEEGDTWMTPIYKYLTEETLLAEKEKARAMRRKSRRHAYARRNKICGSKILTDMILLANNACRCKKDDSGVSRLPGPSKVKFLIVLIDYFTKWIEAKPVTTITGNLIKKDNPFKSWCEKLCIRHRFAFVKHPQANGLVERANRSLGEGIKARLDERSNDWIEEVPHVLWAHRTMIKSSNEDTPFSLTCGTEAVIPAEIRQI
nr:reverse transcriptase domain-containing protein [Tanacetum cinerariifolium]